MQYQSLNRSLFHIEVADSFFKRLNGLMFRRRLKSGHAMLLTDCPQVHTCFMRFPLDVIYLSNTYVVLGIEYALKPWRVGKKVAGTRHILELSAGNAVGIKIGEQLLHGCE